MRTRGMVVVGGGSSERFGTEKLLEDIDGKTVLEHAVSAVEGLVDECVFVARIDLIEAVEELDLSVPIVPGGSSRTLSEMAGLAALGGDLDLIGIHDGARPLVSEHLITSLFEVAEEVGGAVPVLSPANPLIERQKLQPVRNTVVVQTPQVFHGPELLAAYVRAAQSGKDAHDTVEVVHRFGELDIAGIPGEATNLKVTYPRDLAEVRRLLADSSHT